MISVASIMLAAVFLLAPIFIFIIYFLPEKHNPIRAWMPPLASCSVFIALLYILPYSLKGYIFESSPLKFIPDIDLYFRVDLFGLYFGLISSLIWILASFFSIGYMKDEHGLRRFHCFFTLCLYFTLGIAFSGNLFTLFIFYELVTLSGYILILHEETDIARKASRKYLFYTLPGDAFVLFSIFLAYSTRGTLNINMTETTGFSGNIANLNLLLYFTVIGFGVKAAIMPLHGWVADAHPAAPAPASALLSGVLVNVGIFGMARIFYNILGMNYLTMIKFEKIIIPIVLYTIIAASIIAINQDNLKRRLAYSTIGQLSYIVLGLLLYNPNGLIGGLAHIANHAFMKSTLFLCAGAIIKTTGIKNISEMKGLAKRMPVTMIIFTIAALGMIGTPLLCGFVSKWMLCVGALEADQPLYVAVLLVSSLLSAVYFLPIVYKAFFEKGEEVKATEIRDKWYKECDSYMLISMIFGGVLIVLFGIFVVFPGSPIDMATRIAQMWIR